MSTMIKGLFILGFLRYVEMMLVIELDTSQVLAKVDVRYLSVALGMINKNWKDLDLKDQRVINMAKALSPSYVRLGGTGADLAIFNDTKEASRSSNSIHDMQTYDNKQSNTCEDLDFKMHKLRENFTITREDWIDINEFAKKVNWTLLFDVNVILKRKDGCWNSTNFRQLLKFSSSQKYAPIAWELGNLYFTYLPFYFRHFNYYRMLDVEIRK